MNEDAPASREDIMLQEITTYAFFGACGLLALLDVVWPARSLPRIRAWRLKGTIGFVLYLAIAMTAPLLWDGWLGEHRLIDASGLPLWLGALVATLAVEFGTYWWHRAMHRSDLLWRTFHQMHHSAERIDVFGAFYFHPFDVLGFAFVGSFALVMVVGVSAEAAMIANALMSILAAFQHANLRTPTWLGYLVHRPENHAVHHERGVHASNYGSFSWPDLLFGTFRNPARWDGKAGFYDGASTRVPEMLALRDVSTRPERRVDVADGSGMWPQLPR